ALADAELGARQERRAAEGQVDVGQLQERRGHGAQMLSARDGSARHLAQPGAAAKCGPQPARSRKKASIVTAAVSRWPRRTATARSASRSRAAASIARWSSWAMCSCPLAARWK